MAMAYEAHRYCVNTFVKELSKKQNTKLYSKAKYKKIVSFLKDSTSVPKEGLPRFRFYVKTKKFSLVKDVLCVPAKQKDEKDIDPANLGKWRQVVHEGEVFDILNSVHSQQQGHLGYKKTLHEIGLTYEGIPRSVVQHFVKTCPTCQLSTGQSNMPLLNPILADDIAGSDDFTPAMVPMKCLPVRFHPGQELRQGLIDLVKSHQLKAAFVMTCVGSVTKAKLRLADSNTIVTYEGAFEIVSLVGTLSGGEGGHLHISLSDDKGAVFGGHVVGDLYVYTTAEVVIGECMGLNFQREADSQTGYDELVINPLRAGGVCGPC